MIQRKLSVGMNDLLSELINMDVLHKRYEHVGWIMRTEFMEIEYKRR